MQKPALENWQRAEKRRKRIAKRNELLRTVGLFALGFVFMCVLTLIDFLIPEPEPLPAFADTPAISTSTPKIEHVAPATVQKAEYVDAIVTAYTSSVDETDDTPYITASGTHVHLGTAACPSSYAFGTVVVIDGEEYTCEDRMAARYRDTDHFDLWTTSKQRAFTWGKQDLTVTIP
jgi:3D (Asp-Asp-Asp) domain-containing protein